MLNLSKFIYSVLETFDNGVVESQDVTVTTTVNDKSSITLHITLTPEALSGKGPITLRANSSTNKCNIVRPSVTEKIETDTNDNCNNHDQTQCTKSSQSVPFSRPLRTEIERALPQHKTSNIGINGLPMLYPSANVEADNERKRTAHTIDDTYQQKIPKMEGLPVNLSSRAQNNYISTHNRSDYGTLQTTNSGLSSCPAISNMATDMDTLMTQNTIPLPRIGTVIPQAHTPRMYSPSMRDLSMLLPAVQMGYPSSISTRMPGHLLQSPAMLNSLTSSYSPGFLQQSLFNTLSNLNSSPHGTDTSGQGTVDAALLDDPNMNMDMAK